MRIRTDTHFRIPKIRERAAAALLYLQLNGPANLVSVSRAINQPYPRTRYALVTLRQDGLAYVKAFDRVVGVDKIPRFVAQFCAGEGVSAVLPRVELRDADGGLDFLSTLHLQPLYSVWGKTRTPDYIVNEDGNAVEGQA